MSFDAFLTSSDGTATISLAGELDATTAPVLRSLIDRVGDDHADRLVLAMRDLTYMSSAGIRCLVFAHQAVTPGTEIVLLDVQPDVAEVIRLAGLDRAVTFAEGGVPR
jgi:anti-sigma B factor antagonist